MDANHNFLSDYFLFTSDNECPKKYHQWCAISTISAVIGRKVWIAQGLFIFNANLYTIMVGGAGDGKTTAMSVAKNMVRDCKYVPICPTAVTKEKICETMSKPTDKNGVANPCHKFFALPGQNPEQYTQYAVFATEITHFLGGNAFHMIDFLTTIYDEVVYETGTKNKGDDKIIGPYLTILGCLTTETASTFLKQNVISSGFARRCIFVLSQELNTPVPEPSMTDEMVAARHRCVEWLKQLESVKGQFVWTPAARVWYNNFYVTLKTDRTKMTDPLLAGYYKSKHVQLMKVAMCMQLGVSFDLVIDVPILEASLAMLDEAEASLPIVFQTVGRNEQHECAMEIVKYLDQQNKPVLRKRVEAQFYRNAPNGNVGGIIQHLISTEQIVLKQQEIPGTGGKTAQYLISVKAIKTHQAMAETDQIRQQVERAAKKQLASDLPLNPDQPSTSSSAGAHSPSDLSRNPTPPTPDPSKPHDPQS